VKFKGKEGDIQELTDSHTAELYEEDLEELTAFHEQEDKEFSDII
jgi:hypothetical protein